MFPLQKKRTQSEFTSSRRILSLTEVARPFYRACLLVAFAAAALTVGCSKKPVITGTAPTSERPAARATVTLQANATSINKGDAVTLSWSSIILTLGDPRAAVVKQYLVSLGIGAERVSTVSYGKEKPFCMESNESCWQQNRRGHFVMAK